MKITTRVIFPLIFGICSTVSAQNELAKKQILAEYDLKEASQISKSLLDKSVTSYTRALEVAKERNLPISGVTKDNEYFELVKIDPFGNLIYYKTYNAKSRITANVDQISTGGSLGLQLNGENMLVAVIDGAPALENHQEFQVIPSVPTRMILRDNVPDYTQLTGDALLGFRKGRYHATHVAGTIVASGVNPKAKGIAPKAKALTYKWDNDISKMIDFASNDGVLVSNHSYGPQAIDEYKNVHIGEFYFGLYNDDSAACDDVAYRVPFYQPVVAAGNDRLDYRYINPTKKGNDLLLSAATSKNTIVVAAVYDVLNYTSPKSVRMSSFSSFGPTDDFRIKPDISAKGVNVFSPIYKIPTSIGAPVNTGLYDEEQGTSMAAPAVTGVITLWQQWALENNENKPYRSATMRGLMAHTAEEAGDAPGPDHKFGWGLINATAGVEVMMAAKAGKIVLEENTLAQGSEYVKDFVVANSGNKVVATLAWTDPEGRAWSPQSALVNDLDLRIYKDGEEYFPWKLNKDFNDLRALKGDNNVDNIEKIEIENAPAGSYQIKVSHKGTIKSGKQDYTLIVSGDVDANLSIDDNVIAANEIRIWPNPVQDVLHIQIPSELMAKSTSYAVYDLAGKVIARGAETNSELLNVPVQTLASGVYFIEINNGSMKTTQKFVKK